MTAKSLKTPLLTLERVSKLYPTGQTAITALREIDLKIGSGEFVAVMGKSGSGKSSLLHLMGGLDWPSGGRVLWQGRDLLNFARNELAMWRGQNVGFVFQTFNLVPTLTAVENIELPLLLAHVSQKKRRERALELLTQVELSQRAEQKPPTLSGGEQQRIALARALAADPALLLADEPTGNLDSESGSAILQLLTNFHQSGKTVVLATHDSAGAERAGRVLYLRDGALVNSLM
ncbi:ABC transporter ATP-binding protein [Candidatus Acetothermia bacterium]|nr:ABC transporter ATP-binding protein [Candidatus Acetothermia bacterium]MBI3642493.1 ABC transporter ATP-binding protein [Candidatus Acetothermia bacterium]